MQELSFQDWMDRVDVSLKAVVSMVLRDLPDVDYWGLYTTGNGPNEAALYVLRNALDLDTDGLNDGEWAEMLRPLIDLCQGEKEV